MHVQLTFTWGQHPRPTILHYTFVPQLGSGLSAATVSEDMTRQPRPGIKNKDCHCGSIFFELAFWSELTDHIIKQFPLTSIRFERAVIPSYTPCMTRLFVCSGVPSAFCTAATTTVNFCIITTGAP